MKRRKSTTAERVAELVALATELHQLDPERLRELTDELMVAATKRSKLRVVRGGAA